MASFFAEEVLLLCHDLPANVDTVSDTEAPGLPLEAVFGKFSLLSSVLLLAGFWVLLGQPQAS